MSLFEKLMAKSLFGVYPKKVQPIETLSQIPEKVVIISNTALGDTLLSTPAIRSLKHSFPHIKLTAVLKSAYIPLLKDLKEIDEIVAYDGKYKGFMTTLLRLRKERPDLVLILHSNGPQDIELSVLSGASFILKHPNSSPLKKYLSYDFQKKDQHTIEDRLDLIRLIGGDKIEKRMEIGTLGDAALLEKYSKYKNAVGFQIGAADHYKVWPVERFISLAKKIDDTIVITGVGSEWNEAQKIVAEVGSDKVVNLCGETPIWELPYLVNNMKVLVTNDTGTMHLAIALRTPTISLFSATSAKGIGPYQDMHLHKVIQKEGSFIQQLSKKERDDRAMRLIEVDDVYMAYNEMDLV